MVVVVVLELLVEEAGEVEAAVVVVVLEFVLVAVEAVGLELLGLGAVVPVLGAVAAGAPGSVSMVPSGLLAFEPRLF